MVARKRILVSRLISRSTSPICNIRVRVHAEGVGGVLCHVTSLAYNIIYIIPNFLQLQAEKKCDKILTFDLGVDVFITLLVSEPVYMTTPTAVPEARTVLAQRVFSTPRGSSTASPSLAVLVSFGEGGGGGQNSLKIINVEN